MAGTIDASTLVAIASSSLDNNLFAPSFDVLHFAAAPLHSLSQQPCEWTQEKLRACVPRSSLLSARRCAAALRFPRMSFEKGSSNDPQELAKQFRRLCELAEALQRSHPGHFEPPKAPLRPGTPASPRYVQLTSPRPGRASISSPLHTPSVAATVNSPKALSANAGTPTHAASEPAELDCKQADQTRPIVAQQDTLDFSFPAHPGEGQPAAPSDTDQSGHALGAPDDAEHSPEPVAAGNGARSVIDLTFDSDAEMSPDSFPDVAPGMSAQVAAPLRLAAAAAH